MHCNNIINILTWILSVQPILSELHHSREMSAFQHRSSICSNQVPAQSLAKTNKHMTLDSSKKLQGNPNAAHKKCTIIVIHYSSCKQKQQCIVKTLLTHWHKVKHVEHGGMGEICCSSVHGEEEVMGYDAV